MDTESGEDFLMTLISGNGTKAKLTDTESTPGKTGIGTRANGICA